MRATRRSAASASRRVAADIQFDVVAPEPADVLAKLAEDSDTAAALDAYNPPQAGFKALKEKLAELRNKGTVAEKHEQKTEQQRVHVPEGKILRPGMKDARVVALRKRLDVAGDKDSPLYDDAVRDAVKTFQTESDIAVDGNLGPATTRALNGEKRRDPPRQRRSGRHHFGQYGALALAAAQARQCERYLRRRQCAGLFAEPHP